MSEGGWLSEDMVARANAMIEGLNAGLESSDETVGKAIRRMQKSIVEEYEKQERKENMNIEDCKTVNEFFGVERKGSIWIEGKMFDVYTTYITSGWSTIEQDGKALVGCLTGQLKWSKHEPMTAEEENTLREIAAWFPSWQTLHLEKDGDIGIFTDIEYCNYYFGFAEESSQAYEVLAPILEKHGEINLDDYRGE